MRKVLNQLEVSGVIPMLQSWWREDHEDKHAGGRPRFLHDHHILAVSLLLLSEGSPLLITEMGAVFWRRLDDAAKQLLGINHYKNTGVPEIDRERWRSRTYEAYERLLESIDAWPAPKRLMTLDERKKVVSLRDQNTAKRKVERGRAFANAMMEMTVQMMPRRIRRQLSNVVSLDQTAVRAVSPRGRFSKDKKTGEETPPKNTKHHGLVSEIDADYYPTKAYTKRARDAATRAASGEISDSIRKRDQKPVRGDLVWSYMVNLAVMVPENEASHPVIAVAMSLSKPNEDVGGEGLAAAESLIKRGHKPKRMTTDLGYADLKGYAVGLHELGVPRLSDYKKTQLGVHGGIGGSVQDEGDFFCAALPAHLAEATTRLRRGESTMEEYRELIRERAKYRLREKERPDANGRHPRMCPAIGPQAKIKCSLRAEHANEKKTDQPVVNDADLPAIPDRICTQSSVSFGSEDGVEYANAIPFGTDEWYEAHKRDRNAVESFNNGEKNEGGIDIDDPFARRKRGRAAALYAITMMTVQVNIRRILRFLRDESARIKRVSLEKKERRRDRLGISEYARRKGPVVRVEAELLDIEDSDVPQLT